MGQWGTIAKAPAAGIGYSYYPAVWEDSGKLYCKAQGGLGINIYDTSANTWSTVTLPATNPFGFASPGYFWPQVTRNELLWIANGKIYVFYPGQYNSNSKSMILQSHNISTGVAITYASFEAVFGNLPNDSDMHGNWGRNRHKAVVKDAVSGRIFIINFYMKQIYEFIAATATFTLVKTWTEDVGGQPADDIAGCDAVALNGNIYIMGSQKTVNGFTDYTVWPLEISIATWVTTVKSVYPDYVGTHQGNQYGYCDTAWFAVGNNIYGYGGFACYRSTGGTIATGNLLKKIQFNPVTNTWTDLGAIGSTLLQASAVPYSGKAYIIAGYEAGAASQANRSFEYILDAPTNFNAVYNPATMAVDLTWTDNSAEETNYVLQRMRSDESVWSEIAVLPANTVSYSDTTVNIHGFWYRYQLACEKAI